MFETIFTIPVKEHSYRKCENWQLYPLNGYLLMKQKFDIRWQLPLNET